MYIVGNQFGEKPVISPDVTLSILRGLLSTIVKKDESDKVSTLAEDHLNVPHTSDTEGEKTPRVYRRVRTLAPLTSKIIPAVKSTLAFLSLVFLGWEIRQWQRDRPEGELVNIIEKLRSLSVVWRRNRDYYKLEYVALVERAFSLAGQVVQERDANSKYSNNVGLRVCLFASAYMATLGGLLAIRSLKIVGLTSCGLTALFMLVKYGRQSYREFKVTKDFQNVLERAIKTEKENRINLDKPLIEEDNRPDEILLASPNGK